MSVYPPEPSSVLDWKALGTYFGVAVSLFWSWLNWRRSSRIEEEAYRTKRWDDVKSRIISALDSFVLEAVSISMLPKLKLEQIEMVKRLNEHSQSIALKHDELTRRLSEADATNYISGAEWGNLAEGLTHPSGSNWDVIVGRIAEVQSNPASHATLIDLRHLAHQIEQCVLTSIRDESASHDPKRKK